MFTMLLEEDRNGEAAGFNFDELLKTAFGELLAVPKCRPWSRASCVDARLCSQAVSEESERPRCSMAGRRQREHSLQTKFNQPLDQRKRKPLNELRVINDKAISLNP